MAAIERLTTALVANSAALDRATTAITKLEEEWSKPQPTEEAIDAAAATLESQTARSNDLTSRVETLLAPKAV